MIKKYEVGNIYQEAKGHNEGCYFDISDEGASIIVYFDRPTKKEIDSFRTEERFEIRLLELSNIMIFLIKFGSLNWMDAPYTPHLSKELTEIKTGKGKGLATTIMLFDTESGKLESMRFIGFSEKFTREISSAINGLLKKQFDKREYASQLNSLFAKYSTNDFVKMSNPGFKIN